MADPFLDTNVLLYVLSGDTAKADRAGALLAAGGVVSVQVLNEFASVGLGKLRLELSEVRDILATVTTVCVVVPVDIETHRRALDLVERFRFPVYDGLIVAAALNAGCTILFSEDMQHGRQIGRLTIENPFLAAG